MLKVVGASWLQTRISTYILVAVGLLGIGAIILGEFGRVEKDGTYSATVFWNHKGGYRIDFWGQGNDLTALPRGAARAYYKTRILETGWSIVEIETSPSYPDAVQAYAAGLLEGSLTWQLIHHHWYNTIGTVCSVEENEEFCSTTRQKLRENAAVIRERANLLASEDSFWHMVRLFYAQLDGMEAGWRFAVRRSRRSVEIESDDFLWLAMASDLPIIKIKSSDDSLISNNVTKIPSTEDNGGVVFVKSLDRSAVGLEPLIAIAQNTVAPYSKMLRLLKRYTFGYHLSESKNYQRAPARSILMSSYPGALSSHDEYYVIHGDKYNDDILILAAIPLRDSTITSSSSSASNAQKHTDDGVQEDEALTVQGVMSPVRIMAANRLSTESRSWSRNLARGSQSDKKNTRNSLNRLQWITLRPKDSSVWLIEQYSSTIHAADYTENFAKNGFLFCDGEPILKSLASREQLENDDRTTRNSFKPEPQHLLNQKINDFFVNNITNVEAIRNLMLGDTIFRRKENFQERANASALIVEKIDADNSFETIESRNTFVLDSLRKFVYRGDLEKSPKSVGTIDNKMVLVTASGVESFEATSGPPFDHESHVIEPFDWSRYFSKISHMGQPVRFAFDSVVPRWIWF